MWYRNMVMGRKWCWISLMQTSWPHLAHLQTQTTITRDRNTLLFQHTAGHSPLWCVSNTVHILAICCLTEQETLHRVAQMKQHHFTFQRYWLLNSVICNNKKQVKEVADYKKNKCWKMPQNSKTETRRRLS